MAFTDTAYKDIVHRCFRCGFCKLTYDYSPIGYNCPRYHKYRLETYAPGGMIWLINASLVKKELKWSDHASEMLYACAMCANCVEQCRFEFSDDLVNIFQAAKEEVVNSGQHVPPMVGKFLENVHLYGNPFRELRETRGEWAEGLGIKRYEKGDEFLYYVGCVGSYDSCSQQAARALAKVLSKAGVSFGILGEKEDCDGNEVLMLGEQTLFEHQRDKNIQTFKELGVNKIVTLSPHSYNALKNNYPDEFEVFHYTQLLPDLVDKGQLDVSKDFKAKVTFQDPCYLGRHNNEYDAPRQLLEVIPGVEFIEMERNKKNSFCCGGGGGNFYTDVLGGGEDSPARTRVREAHTTGADILAVACPICRMMLEDAVKGEELEEQLAVRDISEILVESQLL
jgi:Fe-S oxidoreductase